MTDSVKTDESRLVEANVAYIGEGVIVKGEISVPDILVVDGIVEGNLTARAIRVGPTGSIKGNIVSTEAEVNGSVSEKVEVKQLLIVRSTGRIDGEISYGEVQIEKGAIITGAFSSTDFRSDKRNGKIEQPSPVKRERLKLTHQNDQGPGLRNGSAEHPSMPTADLQAPDEAVNG